MKFFDLSIHKKMLVWVLLPTLILFLSLGISSYYIAWQLANTSYDDGLEDSAKTLASKIVIKNNSPKLEISDESLQILTNEGEDQLFYEIKTDEGRIISNNNYFPQHILGEKDWEFYNDNLNGIQVRIFEMRLKHSNHVILKVAESLKGRLEVLKRSLYSITLQVTTSLILSILIIWYGITHSLKPLINIGTSLSLRSSNLCLPLSVLDMPSEMMPLLKGLNHIFSEIELDIQSKQNFMATVAHQLKNPIAGLALQSEQALKQDNIHEVLKIVAEFKASTDRSARLVTQLLSLARVRDIHSVKFVAKISFKKLIIQVINDFVYQSRMKNIELAFDSSGENFNIVGNEDSLYDMVSNLIDNAIKYSPKGSTVYIILKEYPALELIIQDSGPGIPEYEINNIFEPFYQIKQNKSDGTGLGLSIVKDVALKHNASVTILEKANFTEGTSISVKFSNSFK